MKRTVGVLLDHNQFEKIPRHITGYEKLELYNKAARSQQMTVLFMSLKCIDFKHKTAKGWMKYGKGYRLVNRPIPAVIHNRAMPFAAELVKKLNKLSKHSIVFNRLTRYGKYKIHRILTKNVELRAHLLMTQRFTKGDLIKMSERFDQLFIKPQSGSVGIGIIKVSKSAPGRWTVKQLRSHKTVTPEFMYPTLRKLVGRKPYLIQEAIPLARYHGKPYDIRVSVQKGGDGNWKITGMVGKVAKKGRFVTNVARGGEVKKCGELFGYSGLPVQFTRQSVEDASLKLAHYLGSKITGLADIGFDVGVRADGGIKLIEMNGRDQRYAFKEAGMKKTWYQTYKNPIRYAKFLLNTKLKGRVR